MKLLKMLFNIGEKKEEKFVVYKKLVESGFKSCEAIIELMQNPKYFHQEIVDVNNEKNVNWIRHGEIYTLYSSQKDLIYKINDKNIAFKSGKGLNFETAYEIFTGSSWGLSFDDKNFLNDGEVEKLGLDLMRNVPLIHSKINEKYDIFDSKKRNKPEEKISDILKI